MLKRTMNSLSIKICDNPQEAPDYNTNGEGFKGAKIEKVLIVRQGTEGGNDTVDIQFTDQEGNKFVAMTTGRLLKSVTDLLITERH